MKFSIIGTGFIFPKHVQAIKSVGGEIVEAIGQGSLLSWQEIIKNKKTDCVVVLAPNNLHFEIALASAKEGKIVLCEKPVALSSKEIKELMNYPDIFTIAQLRYYPVTKELKKKISQKENYKINIDISVHRDKNYYKSWKGQKEESGGMLFNLGVHYFDLLLYLFGPARQIKTNFLTETKGEGTIEGKNYLCQWRISEEEEKEKQKRVFEINGVSYDFYSAENFHTYVYKDLLEKKGITPEEALKPIELIEKIYEAYKK